MKYITWIYLLIILFLLLLYHKGFSVTVNNAGGVLNKIMIYLQGRS